MAGMRMRERNGEIEKVTVSKVTENNKRKLAPQFYGVRSAKSWENVHYM